jgi:hypothetical protein
MVRTMALTLVAMPVCDAGGLDDGVCHGGLGQADADAAQRARQQQEPAGDAASR